MTLCKAACVLLLAAALSACAGHRLGGMAGPGVGPAFLSNAGLSSDRVQALRAVYGTPQLVRKEADAELWRYDGDRCAAFFFLYTVEGDLHVRYVETLPHGRDAAADADCLKSIRTRAAATS